MRRGGTHLPPSAFVPKLSINRSGDSLPERPDLDALGNERHDPFTTNSNATLGGSRGWNAFTSAAATATDSINNNNNNNSSRYTNNNETISAYDQSSPTPHNTSALFFAGTSKLKVSGKSVDSSRLDEPCHGNIIKGYASARSNNDIGRANKRNEINSGLATFAKHDDTRGPVSRGWQRVAHHFMHGNLRGASAPAKAGRALRGDMGRITSSTPHSSSFEDSFSSSTSEDSELPFRDSALFDLDVEPVVPPEVLCASQSHVFAWARHPRHAIILSLFRSRGFVLPRYADLVEYHMSEVFLHYIDLCCRGAYFVRYQAKSSPKERFFSIRMLPRDMTTRFSEKIPYLAWTMHRAGVQLAGCVPLEQLVGITVNTRSASFRPNFLSLHTIRGPRVDNHRLKLPTEGGFSLWFIDRHHGTARSVDLLTCNPTVLDVWTKAFKGLVSVNSSSLVQVPLTSAGVSSEMEKLTKEAQQQVEKSLL
ncbi:hypothetical protein, conserved [Trypanosoma cruzi]|uniref:PH-like domain-containing protein n=1 Tax=Trypanosoma cruzi (strain CL Brener) TaxID=353153 RepID=Q4DV04_TRYCC|nr:hypothetical protein, conserved [Trypanosoma cruzi]EAN96358.1 hypothetical protein, conserved [Trypanosoma cruzi]|eukprot:XP_818209.1 hypothetical protein [Trypanosoma cruzi strain CL Brener]